MKYVVGFTQSPGTAPFFSYESEMAPPDFAIGSKVFATPPGGSAGWLQITAVAYQLHPDVIVTTLVVGAVISIGGEGEEFAAWPW